MISFLDGPAVGQNLTVRRAKFFLRVTVDGDKWDCLNEYWDTARPHENLFVYIAVEKATAVHLKMAKRSESGWYALCQYRFLEPQPPDDAIRDNEKWRAWCMAQTELMAQWRNLIGAE